MKRRTLLGSAAMTLGGASVIGTGAFTSVEAERSVSVDVVGDSNAFLKLEPCDNDGEEESIGNTGEAESDNDIPESSDFVYQSSGTIQIDLTAVDSDGSDNREGISGEGITKNSLWRFPNAFQITNQGTQGVAVDLKLEDSDGEVPTVDSGGTINGNNMGNGSPAVVFYKGANSDERFSSDELDPNTSEAAYLEPGGDPVCIGFDVRTFGLEKNALKDLTLRIRAEAREEANAPTGGDAQRALVFGKPDGNSQRIRKISLNQRAVTNPMQNNQNIDALGPLAYPSSGGLSAPFIKNRNKIKTTGGEEFLLDAKAHNESTLLGVGSFNGSPVSIFYAGRGSGGIYCVHTDGAESLGDNSEFTAKAVAGIGDINDDGNDELVFVDSDKSVEYLTDSGEVESTDISVGSTNSIGQPVEIGNRIKIPIISEDNEIKLIKPSDNSGFSTEDVTVNGEVVQAAQAPLTVIDIDGDSNPEIVYISKNSSTGSGGSDPKLKYIDDPLADASIMLVKNNNGNAIPASSNVGVV